jgi:hypothetical protein
MGDDVMPHQVFACPVHGEIEITLKVADDVPPGIRCPAIVKGTMGTCNMWSMWVPQVPAFPGGPTTGAKQGE